jgi:hypothetical protein
MALFTAIALLCVAGGTKTSAYFSAGGRCFIAIAPAFTHRVGKAAGLGYFAHVENLVKMKPVANRLLSPKS